MAEITAITPQQKDKTRCNIEIDGKFCCGMKLDTVLANGLKAGMSYLEDVVAYVLDKMKDYGFVDDEAFAASYVEGASKRKGSRLIRLELRQKGVSAETVDSALSALEDETESAKRCLLKYLRGKNLDDGAAVQKAYRNLLSKGFDYDTAKEAIESLKNED